MRPGRRGIVRGAALPASTEKVPPSWKLADRVITAGLRGILFPSLRHAGGTNLVIFPANLFTDDTVMVHDPDHRLPQDQSSWS
ncbi:RES family NAD+ phosphorylase [Ancylobacter dichloromethanicus]